MEVLIGTLVLKHILHYLDIFGQMSGDSSVPLLSVLSYSVLVIIYPSQTLERIFNLGLQLSLDAHHSAQALPLQFLV